MARLFEDGYSYPCDRYGAYVELLGDVTGVGDVRLLGDAVSVTVRTDKGDFTGYATVLEHWDPALLPKVGHRASIRVYECGGGWYPDNKITSYGEKWFVEAGR